MAYVKNTWVDQAGQIRYEQTTDEDDLIILTPNYELITEIGTPVNATNMNHIEDGIADCDTAIGQKVSKSGDTMTGSLKFNNTGLETVVLQNIGEGSFSDIRFLQQNNKRVGHIRGNNVSSTSRNIQIMPCADNGDPTIALEIGYKNGSAYCTFPKTTCVDGQWVVSSLLLANNTSLAIGTEQEIEYNLSSYLPNDSYKYEVLVSVEAQTGNSSGAGLNINLLGNGTTTDGNIWLRICDTYSRGSWAMSIGNHAVVPINTNKKLKLQYTVTGKAATLVRIFVEGYRRIGTNS